MADQAAASWGDLLRGRNALRSLALAGGVALHAVNVYVTITILPSVVADIGGLDYYAWNTSLFILASIMGSALSPRVLASLGPRGGYRFATVVFAAGAVICAIAPSMPVLLIGRTVQGFGGGVLFALSYAMIRVVFAEPLWPRAMALISSMWGAATLLGPALGGIFAEFDIWRGAFWALPVLAVPYVLLTNFALPRKEDHASSATGALPLRQLVLLAAAVLAISIGSVGDDPIRNGIGLAAAAVVSAILIAVERRAGTRLLPTGSFSLAAALAPIYLTMSLLVIAMQPEIFVPYFLQVLHGVTPLIAGYMAALMAAGWAVSAIIWSGAGKGAARWAIVGGPCIVLAALITLAIAMPGTVGAGLTGLVVTGIGLALTGFGIGAAWPHLLTRVLVVAPQDEAEQASAGITTVQLFATALGAALAGMTANLAGLTEPGGESGARSAAVWLFATFAVAPVGGIISAALVARRFGRNRSGVR